MTPLKRALDVALAVGNGLAYVTLGAIALAALLLAIRWAYADYYTATHCTLVAGTRVCR